MYAIYMLCDVYVAHAWRSQQCGAFAIMITDIFNASAAAHWKTVGPVMHQGRLKRAFGRAIHLLCALRINNIISCDHPFITARWWLCGEVWYDRRLPETENVVEQQCNVHLICYVGMSPSPNVLIEWPHLVNLSACWSLLYYCRINKWKQARF